MFIQALRWLSFAALLSLPLVYFKGGTFLVRDIRQSIKSKESYYSTVTIMAMTCLAPVILSTQLLICLGHLKGYPWLENWPAVLLGTLMTVLSVSAGYYFRFRYLGRFWRGNVAVQPDHQVVDQGPYGVVRHPLYATTLLMYPGVALAFGVWWNFVACGLMVVGYMLVTGYEDKFLAANLPGYREYQQRTRYRVIPGVW